jgi:transglutaminase-like putative cysteine protease
MVEGEHQAAARDWTRIVLIVGCVLAALTAAMLVPSLASDGIAGSPVDSVLPGERFDDGKGQGGFGDGNGFGALNPGDSTGVGGDTGFDKDTFGNNDTEVHFQVESSESAYWRTGTYGTYTGTGWERDVERMSYGGPIGDGGLGGDRVVYEVEFERPATALPTAWRPTSVSGLTGLEVTETGSVISGETVEPGTSFSAISQQPVRDVDVLQAAGGDYPDDVEDRYTQLPDDTPERVGDLTEELTGDDETAYEAARSIQSWLRTEKGYSLQASRQSEHMADTFIFEMEEGYCEYFATAMTTMLRTQGIPARYTVGYTTGQEIDDNTYEVRGMNAHAWVEVYFPEVGWVRFDPTPGGERLEAQQDTLQSENPDLEYNSSEEGSPGEVFEPGEIRESVDNEPGDEENGTEGSDGYFDVSLNRTAVPGVTVEVTVTHDDEPVSGVTVLFNGEPVGQTDADGTVVATVPNEEELRIGILMPVVVDQSGSSEAFAGPAGSGSPLASSGALSAAGIGNTALQDDEENVTVVDVETEATLSVSGDQYPGSEVTVVATVDDIAIADATLYLDGEQVGRTDELGRATVTLPTDAGNSTLVVERDLIFGETDVRVRAIELDVDTGLVALPLTGASVEVTADGEGIADVPVAVDGSEVVRTGPDGAATVRLPLSQSVAVSTAPNGVRRAATVDGLLRNALLVLVGAGLVIGLPVGVAYRRGYRPADLGAGLLRLIDWGRRAPVGAVVVGRRAAAAAFARVSRTLVYLAEFASGEESAASLQFALAAWFRARWAWLASRLPGRARSDAGTPPETPPVDVPTVRETWDRFLAVLDLEEPETRTPGELARYAIEEADLPREPVLALRDAFRDAEYGDRSPVDSDETLLAAIDAIEAAAETRAAGEDGGSDAPPAAPPGGES